MPLMLNLNISDQLTSISCGHVVVELIKFIAYQRLQIPCTYQWLKQVISKRRSCDTYEKRESLQSERHFRIASTALDNLDFIIKSLLQEIGGASMPEEVCLALGATPVTCKEVYRLLLPRICHKPQCHSTLIANDQKIQRTVFRTLVTCEGLSELFCNQLAPTNLYVFIKKKQAPNQDIIMSTENFVEANGCRIPKKSRIVVIDFRTQNLDNMACCNEFQIFGDVTKDMGSLQLQDNLEGEDVYREIESSDDMKWYQIIYTMKGFKDCTVNGNSVMNGWFQP